jgi:hypothetical protein
MMPILLRFCTGLLLLSLLASGLLPGDLRAEVPVSGRETLEKAYRALDDRVSERRTEGKMPRLSDPADARLLEAFWNLDAILGRHPYMAKDVPALLDIIERQKKILKSYLYFNPDTATSPNTARNGFVFQDEVVRGSVFLMRVVAAAFEAIGDFTANLKPEQLTDIRRDGLKKMRTGLLEMLDGAAQMMRSPDLSLMNRESIAAAFAKSAAPLAAGLTVADRAVLVALARSAMNSVGPEGQKALNAFMATMSEITCKGLCRIE